MTIFKGLVKVPNEIVEDVITTWHSVQKTIATDQFRVATTYRKLPWYRRLGNPIYKHYRDWEGTYSREVLFACSFMYNASNGALKELQQLTELGTEIIYVNPAQAKMINLFKDLEVKL